MQVEPMKPTLKTPATKHMKLIYAELLSNFAFNVNLRRYPADDPRALQHQRQRLTLVHYSAQPESFLSLNYWKHLVYPSKDA